MLLGEAIIGDQHIFVTQMPESEPKFSVLRKMPTDRYRHVHQYDQTVKSLISNNIPIGMFENIKKAL